MKSKQSQGFEAVEKILEIRFINKGLLRKALTHSSAVPGAPEKSNEVLEFLGDAVLELIVREYLLKKYPEMDEGGLNQLKKRYTKESVLYKIGKELKIGDFLIMDRGEELTGGRNRVSNISCCLEAIIGALYLDRGLQYTKKFLQKILLNRKFRLSRDYKSLLNEWAMKNRNKIEYVVSSEQGPPHNKIFFVSLYVDNKMVSEGCGKSKKEAEQDAARKFMKKITNSV
ncbi:MAG: ribonuclease III [candidate division WOR-3 bacterium]|nr:ribonuclease III [candidate division WOR-3 bacterium]